MVLRQRGKDRGKDLDPHGFARAHAHGALHLLAVAGRGPQQRRGGKGRRPGLRAQGHCRVGGEEPPGPTGDKRPPQRRLKRHDPSVHARLRGPQAAGRARQRAARHDGEAGPARGPAGAQANAVPHGGFPILLDCVEAPASPSPPCPSDPPRRAEITARKASVLGATGGIGVEAARRLLARGWQVRAPHRVPRPGAECFGWISGDALSAADVTAAASLVVQGVNPPAFPTEAASSCPSA